MALKNIRIVLINPTHPGNIGAAARAMKTMCLDQLYLVEPKLFPHADATARNNNRKSLSQWRTTEDIGNDFTLGASSGQLQVTVAASGNRYLIEFTRGVNATDGTGSPALFGDITPR